MFKARKQYREMSVPKAAKRGRTFDDFQIYINKNNIRHWVEMDTVIGRQGGKVIMTFLFTQMNFMFGILLNDKTSAEAAAKVRALKKTPFLGDAQFGDIFPLLLTDNGARRKSLNGKSPYDAFVYFYEEDLASLLGVRHIPAEDVVQNTRLLNILKKAPPA